MPLAYLRNRLDERHRKIVRFLISGGTAAVVHFAVLTLLVEVFSVYPVLASVFAFVCAFFVSFTLQKLWTFKNSDMEAAPRQAGIFFSIGMVNLGINAGLMYLFFSLLGFHYLPAQVLTSGLVAVESYFLYKHFVFATTKTQAPDAS
jgi:putative flippase GtrA